MMDNNGDVSRIEHDKVLMHFNWANRRMLIALLIVCLTCIVIVINNTIRETKWQETVKEMQNQMIQTITENRDGTQQETNH